MIRIDPTYYIRYKFANSLFLGLSVGVLFTIYRPLAPSLFSLGGIALAVGMLLVARAYRTILNAEWFFRISLFVELIIFAVIVYFLIERYDYQSALTMYVGYQITFMFGSYLVRAETLLLGSDTLLTKLDTAKQLGYLVGMALSYLIYRLMERQGIGDHAAQVYTMHYLLLGVEAIIIVLIVKSFRRENAL